MRLFIGIDLSAELKQAILVFQSELRQLGVKGSWKAPENFHITLEFMGELEPNILPTLTETLTIVAQNQRPFIVNIGGLGAFPSFKRPHTLWTAVGGGLDELSRLRDKLHRELTNKGFLLEDRQFKPHLTLASRPELDDLDLSSVQLKKLGEFFVAEVTLFESKAIRGKRIYTDLFRACLTK
ncbi:RNA 2',3'-cyclic phosphodiesterase [Desulfitobacterium sp.]|uniref:RNA 2',3'-cyclic phosphodiesterase n=1 Tax=Desulfitobacterium sp. TaxID=49981 RepID=UPI002B97A9E9|nr:RNA 2',3'-cyclic phosphodiesterase [Desulfitobacterium sp.]HVJ48841.1 RNA 2',3'-cyclic phosphodiesterase [Desulfitobacterium sp.]